MCISVSYSVELSISFEKCITAMKSQICKHALLLYAVLLVEVFDAKYVF